MSARTGLSVTKRFRVMVVVLIAGTLGALLGFVAYNAASPGETVRQFDPPVSYPLPPRDMAHLVASVDFVVAGTLTHVQEKYVEPYSTKIREAGLKRLNQRLNHFRLSP